MRELQLPQLTPPRHEKRRKWVDVALGSEAEVEGVGRGVTLGNKILDAPAWGSHERGGWGVAFIFPAEEGPCCVSRICFRQVNLPTRVEPNTGLSSLCECKVKLGGEGLTNVDGIRPERRANRQSFSPRWPAV